MMDKAVRLSPERECPLCGSEGTFVRFDFDTMCTSCSYSPADSGESVPQKSVQTQWSDWHEHRDEEYDGFSGDERIKMVGGFAHAYQFGEDFDV